RLERAVVLDRLLGAVGLGERSALDGRPLERRVHRNARDVHIEVAGVHQRGDRQTNDAGEKRRDVDDGIPAAASECGKILLAVTADLLGLGKQLRVRPPAVEERQLVSTCNRGFDEGAAEEARAAEHEDLHAPNRPSVRNSASAPKRSEWAGTRSSAACTSEKASKPSGRSSGRKPYVWIPMREKKRPSVTPICSIG